MLTTPSGVRLRALERETCELRDSERLLPANVFSRIRYRRRTDGRELAFRARLLELAPKGDHAIPLPSGELTMSQNSRDAAGAGRRAITSTAARFLAAPIVLSALACGEAQSAPQATASNIRHASDESAAGAGQPSTEGGAGATEGDSPGGIATSSDCSLPPDDQASGSCHARRVLARCTSADGSSICITDEGGRCEGTDESVSCENLCEPDEYALSCGSLGGRAPGGATPAAPPDACRSVAPTPGGIVFYCCPCG